MHQKFPTENKNGRFRSALVVFGSIGDVDLRDRSFRVADDRRIRLAFLFSPGEDPAVTRSEPG